MDNNYAVEGSGVTDGRNVAYEADSGQHYTIHNHFAAYHDDNSGRGYITARFRNDDDPWHPIGGVPAQNETGSNHRATHVPTSPTGGTQGSDDDAHLVEHGEKKDMEKKKKQMKKKDGGSTVTNKDAKKNPKKDKKDDASKKGDRGNKGRNHAHGQRA